MTVASECHVLFLPLRSRTNTWHRRIGHHNARPKTSPRARKPNDTPTAGVRFARGVNKPPKIAWGRCQQKYFYCIVKAGSAAVGSASVNPDMGLRVARLVLFAVNAFTTGLTGGTVVSITGARCVGQHGLRRLG